MTIEIANTILLTTSCSGGCAHCPFSNPNMEKLFLSPKQIQQIINRSNINLTVLSGGEPFEHPDISEILIFLSEKLTPFRIATGGFVNLSPWIDQLKYLYHRKGSFKGMSMGTDVLSRRVHHSRWIPNWKRNIQLLSESGIPYSLTLTLGYDLEFIHLNLLEWSNKFESKPEFIYLRYEEEILLQQWLQKIRITFLDSPIIQEQLMSL